MTLTRNEPKAKSSKRSLIFAATMTIFCFATTCFLKQAVAAEAVTTAKSFSDLDVRTVFIATHEGFSSDELLITDRLRNRFLDQLFANRSPSNIQQRDALLRLLQLRKSGKLKAPATQRGPRIDDSVSPIAEIAARVVADRHRVSTDTLLADPVLREELQKEARRISPGVDAYAIRKSLLQLRKKRQLRPELVLRVADWDREIQTFTLEKIREELMQGELPRQPGVYLFRNHEGYLYIGEASDLSARLKQHLTESDRASLANYLASTEAATVSVELHIFPKDSPASKVTVRRAYESELIRSRQPKFNARP